MKILQFTEKMDFTGQSIYVGIDVHKKNWGVCILVGQLEHKVFSQPPRPEVLVNYLCRYFPGPDYYSSYEAGFCGFWIDRELKWYGVNNLEVNPSDIPTSDKEKKQKSDKRDVRKIAKELESGNLKGIYFAKKDPLEDFLLIRTRQKS
ncbi:hypothetical protein [Pseudozobellia sp. WGM2]|uniref:hypothetical protein n=1 Tax=Pseudozobellia sp. WGM2 TaxID=2787625 RepID=UPI001ADF7902|nr:hypothetical protein [Pseudozobellia sp. WGM2]